MIITSMKELLEQYFGNGKNISKRGLLFKIWLFFKGKQYRGRRNRILQRQCKIRSRIKMKKAYDSASVFLSCIPKEDSWQGGYLPKPITLKSLDKGV